MEGKQIISAMEMVAKLKAAVDARVDEDMVIMARTDAIAVAGIEEAIERSNLYKEAGADLIFVEAPTSLEEMKHINESIDAPTLAIQIEGGKTPLLTTKELEELGFSIVVYPNATVYATAWALKELWEGLMREGTTRNFMERMICFEDFNTFIGLDKIRELESYYYGDLFKSLKQKNN
jgi:2-methylisocitrate lyase-like PEP mutase family enzyme